MIRMLSIIAAASIGVTPLGNPLTVCAKPAVVENGIDSTQSSDAKEEKSEEKEALERSDESSDDFFSGTPGSDANETEEKQNADSETVNEKTKEEAVSERTLKMPLRRKGLISQMPCKISMKELFCHLVIMIFWQILMS